MTEDFRGRVLLCWPSDRKQIAHLNALTDSHHTFSPTIEHSLSTCDSCDRSVWIACQQLQLSESPFLLTTKLCLFCVSDVGRSLHVDLHEVDIAPQVRFARKRTL